MQGEYDHYTVTRRGLGTNKFDGADIMAVYTLPGEHRSYNRATTGAYGSITPAHPFSLANGTFGAWEIAARYSYADLRDGVIAGQALAATAVNGGKQEDMTLGMNWYLNTYMRFMFNYVHSDIKKTQTAGGNTLAPLGVGPMTGTTRWTASAVRTQLAW